MKHPSTVLQYVTPLVFHFSLVEQHHTITEQDYIFQTYFNIIVDIRNWIRNIEQHASHNVNKILVGNKADMDESKRVMMETSLDA